MVKSKKKGCCGMHSSCSSKIGLILAIIGIIISNTVMWRIGILFLILGLFHDRLGKKR